MRKRERDEGRHGDQRPRVTLSCEDGLPARDRRSTPLGYENFQGNSAGKVGHQVSRYGRFDAFESLAAGVTSALHFDNKCSLLGTQSSHDCCALAHCRPHFPSACAQNSALKTPKITAHLRDSGLTLAQKIQFLLGPKNFRITAYFS